MKKFNSTLGLLTALAMDMTDLIESGHRETVEDVTEQIRNGTIINWLQQKHGEHTDFSVFSHDVVEIQRISNLIQDALITPIVKPLSDKDGLSWFIIDKDPLHECFKNRNIILR